MSEEVLVKVEGVSKKFCKDLKRSLWYGLVDITTELFGIKRKPELRRDEFWAVNDVSFELKRGECLGLIGHNGAGKSTLLKMLNGLIKPDKGKITMKGRIGALIELGAGFNPVLTGRENVFTNGAVLGFTQEQTAAKYKDIVEFAELEEFMDTPVQNYSSGMKVRLGFAVAAQMEPDILIIDEVLAVGDIRFRNKCLRKISELKENNVSLTYTSHHVEQVRTICDRVILLDHGRLIYNGDSHNGIVKYEKINRRKQLRNTVHYDDHESVIEINDCFVSNDTTNDEIQINQPLTIALQISIKQQIDELVLSITISSSADNKVCISIISNDSGNESFGNVPKGKHEIGTRIANPHLQGGAYYVGAVLKDKVTGQVFLKHPKIKEFVVETSNGKLSRGIINVDQCWYINKND